jgi:hypothetical protein
MSWIKFVVDVPWLLETDLDSEILTDGVADGNCFS